MGETRQEEAAGVFKPLSPRQKLQHPLVPVERSQKAYSTWYSQAVSHPSTNQARPCLASEIGRDRARSERYGRKPLALPKRGFLKMPLDCVSLLRLQGG